LDESIKDSIGTFTSKADGIVGATKNSVSSPSWYYKTGRATAFSSRTSRSDAVLGITENRREKNFGNVPGSSYGRMRYTWGRGRSKVLSASSVVGVISVGKGFIDDGTVDSSREVRTEQSQPQVSDWVEVVARDPKRYDRNRMAAKPAHSIETILIVRRV
jgi:hypothetical protein